MPQDHFTKEEKKRILQAIAKAENKTSGEIRVHLDRRCKAPTVLDRAADVFANLKMHKTELRNGVLIYLALDDHKFAIIGDAGINEKVPDDFWQSTRDLMANHFKQGDLLEGIVQGIHQAGDQLARYFPVASDDQNELPDEISFGE